MDSVKLPVIFSDRYRIVDYAGGDPSDNLNHGHVNNIGFKKNLNIKSEGM